MKKVLIVAMLLACAALSGCAGLTLEEKAALSRAGSLNLDKLYHVKDVDNAVVMVPSRHLQIIRIDGAPAEGAVIPGKNVVILDPGQHVLSVVVDPGLTVGSNTHASSGQMSGGVGVSSKVTLPPTLVSIILEWGKHYRLEHEMSWSSGKFVFKEITDPAGISKAASYLKEYSQLLEKSYLTANAQQDTLDDYMAFFQKNPNMFDGRWQVGGNADKGELVFNGNKVEYTSPKIVLFNKRPRLEGTFFYNERTLIMLWDKHESIIGTVFRKDRPSAFPKSVWLYKLNGNILEVKGGGITPIDISDTYKKE